MSEDLTVAILIEIRDEIRSTNHRVDQTNVRLDGLRGELRTGLDDLRGELRTGLADVRGDLRESELRMATRVTEQTAATRDLYTMLTTQLELRDRVAQCEQDIDELKKRGGRGGPRRIS